MKTATFLTRISFLTVLFLDAASGAQLTIDARGPAQERTAQVSATRGSSTGRKAPLRVAIAVVGDRDKDGRVEVDFTLTNTGKDPLQIPISLQPAGFEGGEPKAGYSSTRLSLWIFPRKRPAGILAGGTTLYGASGDTASMATLSAGESIRVLTRVALPQTKETANEVLIAGAGLGKEIVKEEGGHLVSDLEDIGSAYSEEYILRNLLPGGSP
jgi:hypothetical protein